VVFSSSSPAVCHFQPESSTSACADLHSGTSGTKNRRANRAFAKRSKWPLPTLKNRRKSLFIQQLADEDFALGGLRLSWQK
jgi:hypothetical protein